MGPPTDVQERAWPIIAGGEHVLITAPTGSGKTLTAFLWAINQLATGKWETGYTSILYVSPLKALNNDIYRNLVTPIRELEAYFEKQGKRFPEIRVLTRSGDTPTTDRRRMQRNPPEILITTPESLNLLLTSKSGRGILTQLKTVILDEIHAIVGNKRGVHLITAVDRLIPLSGEFQRLALSATVRPLTKVAEFVGGLRREEGTSLSGYVPRPVAIVQSRAAKIYDVRIRFPDMEGERKPEDSFWDPLIEDFQEIISSNRSTLLFTNSRNLCEKLTLKINNAAGELIAYAHHGSLSREVRSEVERRLKEGALKAIVATNSLELGIDIGSLDEVILIQSPPSISSTIQRIGRAGHKVGEVSRATFFPTHSNDILHAAVLASEVESQGIEAIKPIEGPLDILAQVIVSMVGSEEWSINDLFDQIRTSYPYRDLKRDHFELVLNMLNGRYSESRIRELRSRVSIDRLENTVRVGKGALHSLYLSGGTIPDRGYFHLRHHESNALIGELDEEFVWEQGVAGKTFTLGTQNWRIERVTHNDVFVQPAPSKTRSIPFWIGEEANRDFHFSERIGLFLERADVLLGDPKFSAQLRVEHRMEEKPAKELIEFLNRQKTRTGTELPHRHHLLVEQTKAGPDHSPGNQTVLHTFWGGRLNRPYAMAMEAAWEDRFNHRLEIKAGDDSIALILPHVVESGELLGLVTSANVEGLLRKRLESSGFFGARFRECASRALLITRQRFNHRMPLWMSRLQAQKLLQSVMSFEDFPILLETWRTCLQDEFDFESLQLVLAELEGGSIRWSETRTAQPSPMAQSAVWRQLSDFIYRRDDPSSNNTSNLRPDLIREVALTPGMRPTIPDKVILQFERKRQRLHEGYAPSTSNDLLDWIKERLLIPESEWGALLDAVDRDDGEEREGLLAPIVEKLIFIEIPAAREPLILPLEAIDRIVPSLYPEYRHAVVFRKLSRKGTPQSSELTWEELPPGTSLSKTSEEEEATRRADILYEWLQFYGPLEMTEIGAKIGTDRVTLLLVLEELLDSQRVVHGILRENSENDEFCDGENFESLLRLKRSGAKLEFEPKDLRELPLLLANLHRMTSPASGPESLFRCIEKLTCYPVSASLWETDILPSRSHKYSQSWLDSLISEGELIWVGSENERITLCFQEDLDLLAEDSEAGPSMNETVASATPVLTSIIPDPNGRYDFQTLQRLSDLPASELSDRLWESVWKRQITNDSFHVLRRAIQNKFKVPEPKSSLLPKVGRHRRSSSRSLLNRWKGSLPMAGTWRLLDRPQQDDDLLEREERNKDRVRLLLDRYGILFRELLQREAPAFRWPRVFRTLRIMELSGEVLAGYFFKGIPGPQFISHAAFRFLQNKVQNDTIFWINATDPISMCGIPVEAFNGTLPRRLTGNHLVYRGSDLILTSERNGAVLTLTIPPDDSDLPKCFGVLHQLLGRSFMPLPRITIESINDIDAAESPYLAALRSCFEVEADFRKVRLYRKRSSTEAV